MKEVRYALVESAGVEPTPPGSKPFVLPLHQPSMFAVFPAVKPSFRFAILKGQKEEKTSMSVTGKTP